MQEVKHYRAFQIDPDGHVFGCINLVCSDDEQAKREAAALALVTRAGQSHRAVATGQAACAVRFAS